MGSPSLTWLIGPSAIEAQPSASILHTLKKPTGFSDFAFVKEIAVSKTVVGFNEIKGNTIVPLLHASMERA
jgi:hypothetical protein